MAWINFKFGIEYYLKIFDQIFYKNFYIVVIFHYYYLIQILNSWYLILEDLYYNYSDFLHCDV